MQLRPRTKRLPPEVKSPEFTVPPVSELAYCKDAERNIFGMLERSERAG